MDKSEIVVKKYPNRRLYDTAASAYITLDDVKRLVVEKRSVKVVDAKSGEDLTRQTLMQILLEEESGGHPIFTADMLAKVISLYGHAQHSALGPFLDASVKTFVQGAEAMAKQASAARTGATARADAAAAVWVDLAKAQQAALTGMFQTMGQAATAFMPAPPKKGG